VETSEEWPSRRDALEAAIDVDEERIELQETVDISRRASAADEDDHNSEGQQNLVGPQQ